MQFKRPEKTVRTGHLIAVDDSYQKLPVLFKQIVAMPQRSSRVLEVIIAVHERNHVELLFGQLEILQWA